MNAVMIARTPHVEMESVRHTRSGWGWAFRAMRQPPLGRPASASESRLLCSEFNFLLCDPGRQKVVAHTWVPAAYLGDPDSLRLLASARPRLSCCGFCGSELAGGTSFSVTVSVLSLLSSPSLCISNKTKTIEKKNKVDSLKIKKHF